MLEQALVVGTVICVLLDLRKAVGRSAVRTSYCFKCHSRYLSHVLASSKIIISTADSAACRVRRSRSTACRRGCGPAGTARLAGPSRPGCRAEEILRRDGAGRGTGRGPGGLRPPAAGSLMGSAAMAVIVTPWPAVAGCGLKPAGLDDVTGAVTQGHRPGPQDCPED
jgi:hypothetical protein